VKAAPAIALGVGVVAVLGGGFYLLSRRRAAVAFGVQPRADQQAFEAERANVGAKAVAEGQKGSLVDRLFAANAAGAGMVANKYLPGSGKYVQSAMGIAGKVGIQKVATTAVSAIKKLKFW
jgi:hypothetical protein